MSVVWYLVLNTYQRFELKHILLALLLVIYSLLGGWLFVQIEGPGDRARLQEKYEKKLNFYKEATKHRDVLNQLMYKNLSRTNYTEPLYWCLNQTKILAPQLEQTKWDLWGGIFYSTTVYTTIGYGNLTPNTTIGRVATIIYAIFGIPLVVTILNDWGNLLFRCALMMRRLWKYGQRAFRKLCNRRRVSVVEEKVHFVKDDGTVQVENVPLSLAIFLLAFWICFCAAIYPLWETHWNYMTSFYFFFVSLTTIGLGDVTPERLKTAVLTFILVFIGLAVVGMSLNVIQAKLEQLFGNFEASINRAYKSSLEDSGNGMDAAAGSGHEGIKVLRNKQKFGQKFMFHFMDSHKKKMLVGKWEDKAKLRTKSVQVTPEVQNERTQTNYHEMNNQDKETIFPSHESTPEKEIPKRRFIGKQQYITY